MLYEYKEPVDIPTTGAAPSAVSPVPYIDPLILEREVKNYAELDGLLGAALGPVVLLEEGPLDGPARGFGAMAGSGRHAMDRRSGRSTRNRLRPTSRAQLLPGNIT